MLLVGCSMFPGVLDSVVIGGRVLMGGVVWFARGGSPGVVGGGWVATYAHAVPRLVVGAVWLFPDWRGGWTCAGGGWLLTGGWLAPGVWLDVGGGG